MTKQEISSHKTIQRVMSIPMRRSNNDVIYIPTGGKNRIPMLKAQAFQWYKYLCIKYNWQIWKPSSYISKKAVLIESEDLGNFTLPVWDFCETPLYKKGIKLKNGFGEIRRHMRPCIIRFRKVSKVKSA